MLPLAFDYGQNQLLSTWAAGGHAIAFDYLLPRDVVRAVGRHDVTVLAGVPPLWLQLAEPDWSGGEGATLRTLTNSGGHLPETVVRKLRELFPDARLHLMYGLTEAFRSTSLDPAFGRRASRQRRRSHTVCRSDDRARGRQRSRARARRASWFMRARWSPTAIGGIRRALASASSRRRHSRDMAARPSGRATGGSGRGRPDPLSRPRRCDDQGQRQPLEPERDRGSGAGQRRGRARRWRSACRTSGSARR